MCHAGNDAAEIPAWLGKIDFVTKFWTSRRAGLTPRGPTGEMLTLESSSVGTEAAEVATSVHRTPGAPKQRGAQVKHSTDLHVYPETWLRMRF